MIPLGYYLGSWTDPKKVTCPQVKRVQPDSEVTQHPTLTQAPTIIESTAYSAMLTVPSWDHESHRFADMEIPRTNTPCHTVDLVTIFKHRKRTLLLHSYLFLPFLQTILLLQ